MPAVEKPRPYQCQLCAAAVAEDELGFVCEHVAHGAWQTIASEKPTREAPMPDAPCTACAAAMEAGKKNAEEKANIHVVCQPCYRKVRAQSLDAFTKEDEERGYVLLTRAHHDRIVKREINLDVGPMEIGRTLKLGFVTLPSTSPIALERMWVRVVGKQKGGIVEGLLANNPSQFKRRVLKADSVILFKPAHVLETEPPKAKRSKEPRATPASKKAKTALKKAREK